MLLQELKEEKSAFLNEIGIDNYTIADNGNLTIPVGWKGKYKQLNRELTPDEQTIIEYIETWG